MNTNVLKNEKTIFCETEEFFDYIKTVFRDKINMYNLNDDELIISQHVFCIPFNFDRQYLQELCDDEGIRMWYSSSNDKEGIMNFCPLYDKINFSQKTSDIIIKNNLKMMRRMG